MKRFATLIAASSAVLTLLLPFVGGSGPSFFDEGIRASSTVEAAADEGTDTAVEADLTTETIERSADAATAERRAQIELAGGTCPAMIAGDTASIDTRIAGGGLITGTTTDDLADFAAEYNAIRIANCLLPVPMPNFRHDECMLDRLVWMAEDPSDDPLSAWGHIGSERSDGVPSIGCDGNLAGGTGDTGASVASKWWESPKHQLSLFQPDYAGAVTGMCVYFDATVGCGEVDAHSRDSTGIVGLKERKLMLRRNPRWRRCDARRAEHVHAGDGPVG